MTSHDLQQLLLLETNLFLGGLALHDQHRDMRLDIDNMSYEVCNSTSYCRCLIVRRDLCQWYINSICILCSQFWDKNHRVFLACQQELLALEERMGTVSTGVPEEALMECLKKDVHKDTGDCRGDVDDIKCSICQVSTNCLSKVAFSIRRLNCNCENNRNGKTKLNL